MNVPDHSGSEACPEREQALEGYLFGQLDRDHTVVEILPVSLAQGLVVLLVKMDRLLGPLFIDAVDKEFRDPVDRYSRRHIVRGDGGWRRQDLHLPPRIAQV